MPLNRDFVGREYPASGRFEVGREHIRQFAESIGDGNLLYHDADAAKAAGHPDVVAPPTFLTVLTFRFRGEGAISDPDLGLDYSRVVHGEQGFELHRPVYAGDVLTSVTRVAGMRDAGRNELMTSVIEVRDVRDEPVATITSTLVSRGTAASREQ